MGEVLDWLDGRRRLAVSSALNAVAVKDRGSKAGKLQSVEP